MLQKANKNITNKEKTHFVYQTEKYFIVLNDGVQGWDGTQPSETADPNGTWSLGQGLRACTLRAKVYLQDDQWIHFLASEV